MLDQSLHCYLAYLPAEAFLALLPSQLQHVTGLTFFQRLSNIPLWVQTTFNAINDDWLLTAFKAQQTFFPFCPIPGRADREDRVLPHLAPCGSLGQQAPGSTGRNPASSQPPPNPKPGIPWCSLAIFRGPWDLHCSLHKDSLCK